MVCCLAGYGEARVEVTEALPVPAVSVPGFSAVSAILRTAKAGFVCAEDGKTISRHAAAATAYARDLSSAAALITETAPTCSKVMPSTS